MTNTENEKSPWQQFCETTKLSDLSGNKRLEVLARDPKEILPDSSDEEVAKVETSIQLAITAHYS